MAKEADLTRMRQQVVDVGIIAPRYDSSILDIGFEEVPGPAGRGIAGVGRPSINKVTPKAVDEDDIKLARRFALAEDFIARLKAAVLGRL